MPRSATTAPIVTHQRVASAMEVSAGVTVGAESNMNGGVLKSGPEVSFTACFGL